MSEKHNLTQFKNDLQDLSLNLTDVQLEQLITYYELLVEWNEKINLTSITAFDEVFKKHFIDSLSLVKAFDLTKKNLSVLDVGTGAGFPGLVLKIAFPELNVILLDSLNKRIFFLNLLIGQLGLKNISAIHGRAEDYARDQNYREKFDLCVSRAVANLTTLSEYCIPFVKLGGSFISYKSSKSEDEMNDALSAVKLLGGKIERVVDFYLPFSNIYRNLIVIDKVSSTSKKFPRKAGLPAKEPLK